jgi:AcrR family transcriptional regulator
MTRIRPFKRLCRIAVKKPVKEVLAMNEIESRRVKMTKHLLKNSLIELMQSKSITKITIKEICANADVNRSTFYTYYADQLSLLDEVETEVLAEANEHMKKIDYNGEHYLEELLLYVESKSDIFRIFLCRPENYAFQSTFIDAFFINLKKMLFLDCDEKIGNYVYGFLISGCVGIIKRWIESGYDVTRKDLAHVIMRLSREAAADFANIRPAAQPQ